MWRRFFDFQWNNQANFWTMYMCDPSATVLITRKLTVGTPLLIKYSSPDFPTGDIMAVDTSNQDLDPGLTDLGDRVILLYASVTDMV